jgi:hypothetical protein
MWKQGGFGDDGPLSRSSHAVVLEPGCMFWPKVAVAVAVVIVVVLAALV